MEHGHGREPQPDGPVAVRIDKRLEAALPEKPVKRGLTSVSDDDLRAAIAAIRGKSDTQKPWKW